MNEFEKIFTELLNFEYETKLGGPGIIVEIDVSKFGKRKYYRGHPVEGTWVLRIVELTNQRRIRLFPVETRDSNTLKQIIKSHVEPGTIIRIDLWRGYNCLKNSDFIHETVNHSRFFVDTVTRVHINTIEGNWAGIKRLCPPSYRRIGYIGFYLSLFELKRLYGDFLYEKVLDWI